MLNRRFLERSAIQDDKYFYFKLLKNSGISGVVVNVYKLNIELLAVTYESVALPHTDVILFVAKTTRNTGRSTKKCHVTNENVIYSIDNTKILKNKYSYTK